MNWCTNSYHFIISSFHTDHISMKQSRTNYEVHPALGKQVCRFKKQLENSNGGFYPNCSLRDLDMSRHCESNPFQKAVRAPKYPTAEQRAQRHIDVANDLWAMVPYTSSFDSPVLIKATHLWHLVTRFRCEGLTHFDIQKPKAAVLQGAVFSIPLT